jgi:surfeit locus 1 family protein
MTAPDRPPRIWPLIVATLIGTAILVTLGIWQVQRLQWKEALLAQLAANTAAPAVSLAEAAARPDPEYMRVSFTGQYRHDAWMKMISTFQGSQGWTILTPAVTADGYAVIVDRGRVPGQMLEHFSRPGGDLVIEGVIRTYRRGQGMFDPENDPRANLWYWWDVPAMLAASRLPDGLKPFPYVVQLLPAASASDFPRPEEPKANLTNNHLGYAITWFGLALTLMGVAGVYIRDIRRRQRG